MFWHFPDYGNQGGEASGSVLDGDWKLIEWYEDGRTELYDLAVDIGEQKDLASERPADATRLRKELARWRDSVAAQMPSINPEYRPAKSEKP